MKHKIVYLFKANTKDSSKYHMSTAAFVQAYCCILYELCLDRSAPYEEVMHDELANYNFNKKRRNLIFCYLRILSRG